MLNLNFMTGIEKGESFVSILHCTFNVAPLDVTSGISLEATHMYSPLSLLFTFVMVSCLLNADKLILGFAVVFIADPLLIHDRLGSGLPYASHEKVTLDPSVSV